MIDNFTPPVFRSRKTHFPKTYFLFEKEKILYLLFWLEYGQDNSLYVWFDDDPNKGWEVTAVHTQENVIGTQEVSFQEKPLNIFDPHISWHQSGRAHVSGYNAQGKKGEHLISDKDADSFQDLEMGMTTPVTQMVFPVINPEKNLKSFGKGPKEMYQEVTWVGLLDKKGFRVMNDKAPAEAFFIIDDEILPDGFQLAVDIGVHHKQFPATFIGPEKIKKDMLFQQTISLHKEKTLVAAAIRFLKVKNLKETRNAVATCYNRESADMFLLHRTEA